MTKPKNWQKTVYSIVDFMLYLDKLHELVDKERKIADELQLSEMKFQVYELIGIPYVELIRNHFISLGYTVSFLALASHSSNKNTGDILTMHLTW